jgi:ferritin
MLSKSILEKLNNQVNLEFFSSNLYLQMSAWCNDQGLEGCSQFLRLHAEEEKMHMYRLFDYINETGAMAVIGTIEAPDTQYESIIDVFKKIYEHECLITKAINDLVDIALAEKDFSTFNFLQWYVSEQHEEEHLFLTILEKSEMIGTDGRGLYHLDMEMKKMSQQRTAAPSGPPGGA